MRPIVIKKDGDRRLLVGEWPKEVLIAKELVPELIGYRPEPLRFGDQFMIRLDNSKAMYVFLAENEAGLMHCRLIP